MAAAKNDKSAIDTKVIRQLAEMLNDTDLNEVEVEVGDFRVRLARGSMVAAAPAPVAAAQAPAASAAAPTAEVPVTASPASGEAVPSPMVGTAYLSPAPGAAAFVKVGDKVTKGQTILIVEAMKTMNQIAAPRDGTVEALNVTDGQPVEFGETLLTLA